MTSDTVFEAIEFAARAHRNQHRKGTMVPYIIHPLSAAHILIDYGCSQEVVVAGVLHDTLEDTSVTIGELRERFGAKVAGLVEGASEPDRNDTWEHRKLHTVEYLKKASADVALVSCADKLDNIRSIRHDHARLGDKIWARFKRDREKQSWYYGRLAEAFRGRPDGEPGRSLFREFVSEVETFFADDHEAARASEKE